MTISDQQFQEISEGHVKVVIDAIKQLNLKPNENPDTSKLIKVVNKILIDHGFLETLDNEYVKLTDKGWVLLAVLVGHPRFKLFLDSIMLTDETKQKVDDLSPLICIKPNVMVEILKLVTEGLATGYCGLLVNIVGFQIYDSIVTTNEIFEMFNKMDQDPDGSGPGNGTFH